MSRSALVNLLHRGLAHRYLPVELAGIAVLPMIPCLRHGWIGDDLIHRAWLVDRSQLSERLLETGLIPADSGRLSTALMGLFSFAGSQFDAQKLIASGVAPWWTSSDTLLSFWRPLAALTHWVDYRLWPDSAALMHAHSLLWFGAVVFIVTLLYRQFLGPAWISGLAALFYALDESFYFPVASIANRNALISLFFGVLAVMAHDRWRRRGSRVPAILSPLCLLLSLLSAEAGISTVAYLVAYAMFVDRASWTRRALSLTPTLIVAGLWRTIYSSLGYGVRNSGLYLDPAQEPLRFVAAVLERGPILFLAQWGWPSAEVYWFISAPLQKLIWVVALSILAFVLIILLPLLRRDRVARFWAVGMLASLVPACTMSAPSNRLLLFAGLGAMGLAGQFIEGLQAKGDWAPDSRTWQTAARGFCLVLLVSNVGVAGVGRLAMPEVASYANDVRESMLQVGSDPELENQGLVIVNSPSPLLFLYFPFLRDEQAAPLPRTTRVLAPAFAPLEVVRTDENTLVVSTRSSSLLSMQPPPRWVPGHTVYTLWRINDTIGAKGFSKQGSEPISLPDVVIEVSNFDEEGLPKEATFRFAVPLADPALTWLTWDWRTWSYEPFEVPAVGESVQIAGPF